MAAGLRQVLGAMQEAQRLATGAGISDSQKAALAVIRLAEACGLEAGRRAVVTALSSHPAAFRQLLAKLQVRLVQARGTIS